MAVNSIYKYVWLVKTIYNAGKISLADINAEWLANDISEGKEISRRTFLKWRNEAEDIFGISIENENGAKYRYFINTPSAIENNTLLKWLMHSVSVGSMLMNYKDVSSQIILEDIPSSDQFMMKILQAIKLCRVISVTYQSFHSEEPETFELRPLGIKLFRQRWYLLAYIQSESPKTSESYVKKNKIFAFDRVESVEITKDKYKMPDDFDLNTFFDDYFGVIINDDTPLEKVRIKVTSWQACYFRTLPLHKSQKEVEKYDGYSIFEYNIHPTFDFQKELLSHGSEVEVLAPTSLRNLLAEEIKKMNNLYK